MADLRKTAKAKGMGGFLQVTQLMEEHPGLETFFSIITGVKPAPPGVENASLILILDETPVSSCNEVALNQSNTNRVIKFLEHTFGSADDALLIDCAIHFRIKEYPGYLKAGTNQYGLEIHVIEPADLERHEPMTFESIRPVAVEEQEEKPNPAAARRAAIQARLDQQASSPAPAKKAAATKKRR